MTMGAASKWKTSQFKGGSIVDLVTRVFRGLLKGNCDVYAAQMAYFFLFALFPFLLFLTSLIAYLPVPGMFRLLMRILGRFVPGDVLSLVEGNLHSLVSIQKGGLLSIGVLLTLWTVSNAVTAVIAALNDAFNTKERRPWWKVRCIAVLLVFGLSFFIIVSLLLLIFGPRIGLWIASLAGFDKAFTIAWNVLRWPVIICFMVTALSALYRFAPMIRLSWRETLPGAVTATGAWVTVSFAFSYYVNNFESYDKTYGSIGAVIALLIWMYASGFAILIGGEVNARLREPQHEMETVATGDRHMRKSVVAEQTRDAVSAEQVWLDLTRIALAELTSEDSSYPVESALSPTGGAGWRAAEPGRQTLRLLFDEPLRLRHVYLEFHEHKLQRAQEFVLRWSSDSGRSWHEIVRQQYNFSPPDFSLEVEEYKVDLAGVTALELNIVPDISGGDVRASLARLLLA